MFFKQIAISLLLVFLHSCLPYITAAKKVTTCNNCTTILPRLHIFKRHVLSRRKRSILFPKKAFVLLSQAFTKAVIDGRPPGVSYSIEFDMYSTLPDTVEAWQPTILNERLKNEQKFKESAAMATPSTPQPLKMPLTEANIPLDMSLKEFDHPNDIWPADWDYSAKLEQYDHHAPNKLSPRNWPTLYNITRKQQHYSRQKNPDEMKKFYKKHTWKSSKRQHQKKYNEPTRYTTEDIHQWPPIEEVYESADQVPSWKYHQAYRERRELFEQLETFGKIFNFDMKACIKRAMCEMRKNLRPYGESLMEDIVRIILTVPKKLNFNDDYFFDFSQTAQKEPNCEEHFKQSCPFKVLDFLTATLRTASMKHH